LQQRTTIKKNIAPVALDLPDVRRLCELFVSRVEVGTDRSAFVTISATAGSRSFSFTSIEDLSSSESLLPNTLDSLDLLVSSETGSKYYSDPNKYIELSLKVDEAQLEVGSRDSSWAAGTHDELLRVLRGYRPWYGFAGIRTILLVLTYIFGFVGSVVLLVLLLALAVTHHRAVSLTGWLVLAAWAILTVVAWMLAFPMIFEPFNKRLPMGVVRVRRGKPVADLALIGVLVAAFFGILSFVFWRFPYKSPP
jgi:hypothetical protein